MGGACLRGHGHHWPARGPGSAAPRGRRQSYLAAEPDPAGADARPQLLRAAGDADAVDDGESEDQPHRVSNSDTVGVRISVALGDRGSERLCDAVPIADRHDNAVTLAEWQRKGVELALAVRLSRAPRRTARSSHCVARSARVAVRARP